MDIDYNFHHCTVYVISISTHTVELKIPAWHDTITVDIKDIPIMFYGVLLVAPMMTAYANIGVLKKEDLIIKNYQLV